MGWLVDRYFIRVNKKHKDIIIQEVLNELDPKYHEMMTVLWNRFHSLSDIMDSENFESISTLLFSFAYHAQMGPRNRDEVRFTDRYRGDCLQKELRTKFFDTLFVIQNQYNCKKYNYYYVVDDKTFVKVRLADQNYSPDDAVTVTTPAANFISEEQCENEKPEDQIVAQELIDDLSKANQQGVDLP